jgi:hypothetical protein
VRSPFPLEWEEENEGKVGKQERRKAGKEEKEKKTNLGIKMLHMRILPPRNLLHRHQPRPKERLDRREIILDRVNQDLSVCDFLGCAVFPKRVRWLVSG